VSINKHEVLSLIISKLEADISISEQAVQMARDTATHKDCLGSSKYETMGLEASYLAQGQGTRLLELERSLAHFKQLKLNTPTTAYIQLSSLFTLENEDGKQQTLWMAADAGGLIIMHQEQAITVITPKSPLGKALLGKAEGEDFELNIAGKKCTYQVTSLV